MDLIDIYSFLNASYYCLKKNEYITTLKPIKIKGNKIYFYLTRSGDLVYPTSIKTENKIKNIKFMVGTFNDGEFDVIKIVYNETSDTNEHIIPWNELNLPKIKLFALKYTCSYIIIEIEGNAELNDTELKIANENIENTIPQEIYDTIYNYNEYDVGDIEIPYVNDQINDCYIITELNDAELNDIKIYLDDELQEISNIIYLDGIEKNMINIKFRKTNKKLKIEAKTDNIIIGFPEEIIYNNGMIGKKYMY